MCVCVQRENHSHTITFCDSHTALQVVEGIKKVSDSGASVLLTIHQPNHQMFQALDHIMLLHHGRTMFQGAASDVGHFFGKQGYPIPHGINPADWMLIVSQEHTEKELEENGFFEGEAIHSSMGSDAMMHSSTENSNSDEEEQQLGKASLRSLDSVPQSLNDTSRAVVRRLSSRVPSQPQLLLTRRLSIFETVDDSQRLSIVREISILMQREAKTMFRTVDSLLKRLGLALFGGALTAVAFQGVADGRVESILDFQSHVGALFFMIFTNVIATELILFEFVLGRPLFEREFATNHFRMASFGISKAIVESVSILLPTVLGNAVAFWAVGFQGRFWYLVSVFAAYGLVSASLGVMIGSIPRDATKAVEYVTLSIIPQLMLSGFYVATSQLPRWLRWAQYAMPLTYAYRLSLQEEFAFCSTPSTNDQHIVDCVNAMLDSGLAFGNEGAFFNENSTYILPQTGIYKGQQAIEEYTALFPLDDDPNALFQDACFVQDTLELVVNDASPGYCNVFFGTIQRARPNPEVAAIPVDETVENAFGLRMEFSHENSRNLVIDNMYLEYINPTVVPEPISRGLDFAKAATEICDTLQNTCGEPYFGFDNQTACVAAMRGLPDYEFSTSTDPPEFRLTSNTTGCRTVHLYLARNNPEGHCGHISYESQADPDGHLVCDPSTIDVDYVPLNEMEQSVLNMVSGGYGLDSSTKSRVIGVQEAGECMSNPAAELQRAFLNADPFEDLDFTCYTFLRINDANATFTGLYWGVLLGMILLFRLLSLLFLRMKVVRVMGM